MNPPGIVTAKEGNRERVIQSMVPGFSADPLTRWFWPEASVFLKSGPLFDAFGGRAIDNDAAYVTWNYEGAALWRHPGVEPDEERSAASLESSNPRNISLYERHGFEIMGQIQVGTSPTIHPMLRPGR